MLVVALVDFYRKGPQATKCREYGFIVIAGAIGAAVGLASVSSHYLNSGAFSSLQQIREATGEA